MTLLSLRTNWKKWSDLPNLVWLVLASAFFAGMALRLNWLFLNFYLETVDFNRTLIGYANAVPAISMVIFGIPAGIYAPRIGYTNSLRLASLLSAVGLLLVGLTSSTQLIFIGLFGFGVGNSLVMATTPPLLQQLTANKNQVLAFSWYGALGTSAGFFGNIVGGYLPGWLGGLDGVIYLMAVLIFISLLPLWPIHNQVKPSQKKFQFRQRRLWLKLLLPNTLISVGAGAIMPFLNLYLADKFGLSFKLIGLIFSLSALATTLAIMIQPALVARWGKVGAILASQGSALPFILIIAYLPFLPLVTVALFVREALMNAAHPTYTALALSLLPEEEGAAYMIANGALWNVGWALSASLSGTLQEGLGVAAFNYLFAGMFLLYISAILLSARFFWRDRMTFEQEPALAQD